LGQIEAFAEARLRGGLQTAFAGHFHQSHTYRTTRGMQLHTLPAWFDTGCVSRYDTRDRTITSFVPAGPRGLTCRRG
jgi:hypothetical protein